MGSTVRVPMLRTLLPLSAALLLGACGKKGRQPGPPDDSACDSEPAPDSGIDCDSGLLDDDGECVPAACGSGTWGELELDESTVYVDSSAAEGGDGSQAAPFTSIQAGLDAAGAAGGGMVAVAAGTYLETLELERSHADVHLAGRCKELVTIDASAGQGETPGIEVDVKSKQVEVSGVTLNGSPFTGVLIVSGSATLRDSTVQGNEVCGITAYQAGSYATSLSVESCEVTQNAVVGIFAFDAGVTIELRETSIQDTQPDQNGNYGYGVYVQNGARLELDACQVSRNTAIGVFATDTGSTADLWQTTVDDTQPDPDGRYGYGVLVQDGAGLELDSCLVSGNAVYGIYVAEAGTTADLLETTIQRTQAGEHTDYGYGIQVMNGATLNAEDCVVEQSTKTGLAAAGTDTSVFLRETSIQDTQPTANGGHGVGIQGSDGVSLELEACLVSANRAAGIFVQDEGTTATLRETTVQDTQPEQNGEAGYGIDVYDGASLVAEDCEVLRNTATGVLADEPGSNIVLRGTTIQDTWPHETRGDGYGIQVVDGASLQAESCLVSGNAMAGVVAIDDATVSLHETTVQDTQPDLYGDSGFGIVVLQAASLSAQACDVLGSSTAGLVASGSGSAVTLLETTIQDTRAGGQKQDGFGIGVLQGASLSAEACAVEGNTSAAIFVSDSGSSAVLADTIIAATTQFELYTVGTGLDVVEGAQATGSGLEIHSNQGPGIYVNGEDSILTCSECALQGNQFAGAVVVAHASLVLENSIIEGTTAQENLGGGVGLYAEALEGGPPSLTVADSTIQDNPLSGVWLSGEGSFALIGNTIRGGGGWTREGLTKCGDAVYAREGVTAWDGSSGLLLEGNQLTGGLGAGLFLDHAAASLSGNSYADNAVDLVVQGTDCATPPEGYEGEALDSAELCPTYDYATCVDEFAMFLELSAPAL